MPRVDVVSLCDRSTRLSLVLETMFSPIKLPFYNDNIIINNFILRIECFSNLGYFSRCYNFNYVHVTVHNNSTVSLEEWEKIDLAKAGESIFDGFGTV